MNHAERALYRIIYQYRNSEKFRDMIRIIPGIGTSSLSTAFEKIVNLINVDTATGDALDICGRIAGIDSRPMILPEDIEFFGYNGTPGASNYGVGPYRSGFDNSSSVPAPDYLFRILIKSKIFKNNSSATIDDIKYAVEQITGDGAYIVDGQDMTIQTVYVSDSVSDTLMSLMIKYDLIPRPQGVMVRGIERMTMGFGYNGQIGATGYGENPYRSGI